MGLIAALFGLAIGFELAWIAMLSIGQKTVDQKNKRRNRADAIAALMRFDRPLSEDTIGFITSEVYEIATNGEYRQCLEVTGIRRCSAPSVVIGYKISEGQLIAVHGCERGHRKDHSVVEPAREKAKP